MANLGKIPAIEDRSFFRTVVQLVIGLPFISVSATVTTSSVEAVVWPSGALVLGLIVLVRPSVTAVATVGTNL